MTHRQKIDEKIHKANERQRGVKAKINAFFKKDSLSDDERSELEKRTNEHEEIDRELDALNVERRAAVAVEDDAEKRARDQFGDDPEDREKREIRSRVSLGNYLASAQENRSADGAEHEYAQACGCRPGRFPLHLIVPSVERRSTTDVSAQATQQTWIDRLFAESMAMAMGVTFKSVMPGVASVPVTTAGSSGGQIERGETKADAPWTVSVIELKPKRNTVKVNFSMEDDYRIPGLEPALRRDMQMEIAENVDRAVFLGATSQGSASVADITGLTTATGVVEKELTQTEKVQADEVLKIFVELIDGKHATMIDDLSVILTVGANTLWKGSVLEVTSETASVFKTLGMFLKENGLHWRVRGDLETNTANGDWGAFIGRQRNIEGAACAAIWDEGQFIRSEFEGAGKGEVNLSLAHISGISPRPAHRTLPG